MRTCHAVFLLACLAAAGPALAQSPAALAAKGKTILTQHCSRCHQVGPAGPSRLPDAPPFHEIMRQYDPEDLEEALAEGLSTGHPDMPEFAFEPEEIAAILAYLATLRRNR